MLEEEWCLFLAGNGKCQGAIPLVTVERISRFVSDPAKGKLTRKSKITNLQTEEN